MKPTTHYLPLRDQTAALIPYLFFYALLFIHNPLFSQSTIQGRIQEASQHPLGGCNVLLLTSKDSLFVAGAVSNHNGHFELKEVREGKYLLVFSFAGYQKKYDFLEVTGLKEKDLGQIILASEPVRLKQVTVTAYKPLFEQLADRIVVYVKNSITNAGGSVLDVLEKSPGILLSRENSSISMNGKDGVQVMINGKRNFLDGQALLAMLEGISANNVEKIELITNPPAKYDAAGNAGYINIVFQKNPDQGFNATLTLTMAAFYGTAPAAGFDFNYRKEKSNFYGNYGFNRRTQKLWRYSYRKIDLYNEISETTNKALLKTTRPNHNFRLGYDYDWTKKTTVGLLASGYENDYNEEALIRSVISTNSETDTTIIINSRGKNPWKHVMGNVYLQHRPSAMIQWNFNLDVLFYNNRDAERYNNNYYNRSQDFVYANHVVSLQEADFIILPLQLDYKRTLNEKTSIEAGLKRVYSKFKNEVLVADVLSSGLNPNPDYSATYKLKENIVAAYISSTYQVNMKNTVQAGLRYEYTDAGLGTETQKNIVDKHYGTLFPSISWSHKLRSKSSFNLSYSRRINRPAFNQLAPFLFFSDPSSIITGNPTLQPAVSSVFNIDYLVKQVVISIGYTHESNYINGFLPLFDTLLRKQVSIPRNITYLKTLSARITLPLTIKPWWSSLITINASLQKARAENYVSIPKERKAERFFISGSETFRFAGTFSFEVSGLYVTRGLAPNGIGIRKVYGNLNLALQQKFKYPGTSLTIGVDNIFSSMNVRGFTDLPEANFFNRVNLPSPKRIFKITFTHRLGNKAMKEKKARNTASDEERKRVSN